MKRIRNQRGAALLETAITIPLVLLVTVSIFEFGRAYQTWQVLTNAAREGARVAILGESTDAQVTDAVRNYMQGGQLQQADSATITVERTVPFGSNTASKVTVTYPFNFTVLNPVIRLVQSSSTTGQGTTNMVSSALMRNES
ncbi:MAG TPA: TadE/TadG family type IV pilus assembly protein [Vicinamibacterales bacterium]|nr:TadE/TadG family type IV pilus assembly protein [Vicinamibacterales bacterium]